MIASILLENHSHTHSYYNTGRCLYTIYHEQCHYGYNTPNQQNWKQLSLFINI